LPLPSSTARARSRRSEPRQSESGERTPRNVGTLSGGARIELARPKGSAVFETAAVASRRLAPPSGGRGARTLAALADPTRLATAPLHQLEYPAERSYACEVLEQGAPTRGEDSNLGSRSPSPGHHPGHAVAFSHSATPRQRSSSIMPSQSLTEGAPQLRDRYRLRASDAARRCALPARIGTRLGHLRRRGYAQPGSGRNQECAHGVMRSKAAVVTEAGL
jgi:hypothetical protein